MFDFHIPLSLFPAGLFFCFKKLSDATIFIVIYGLESTYLTGVMGQLILIARPAVCLTSAVAVSATVKNLTVLLRLKNKEVQTGSTKGTSSAKASASSKVFVDRNPHLLLSILLFYCHPAIWQ
ncbi:dolichyl-diphosphooligosaccharide--protein glycosyltransferase subunit STT3B-like [Durio zibethinus]|uniref:Dolichyl-diphosphooligosaccharide--protein glycosyltransferase subunit STT3B-like n=1 Tax=Durio zibethinus TaxID=66656 RepID=A0A6P6AIN9_DURZI|nr:dolichyl-diphosphooligosaccharide--protein glycosyltransferase subunit STT3B-like [Durio zibethinus]